MRLTKKLATLAMSAQVFALGGGLLETGQIGRDDVRVGLLRKQQRDIDVDCLAGELADGRKARLRGWHLDHNVRDGRRRATDGAPPRSWPGVHRQVRRHLEAHEPVTPIGPIVEGPQDGGGMLDVLDRQPLVKRIGVVIAFGLGGLQRGIVVRAVADGLLENRGVRRHAGEAIVLNQSLEISIADQAARQKVEPDRLPGLAKLKQGIAPLPCLPRCCHSAVRVLDLASWSLAAAAMASTVKPNLPNRSLRGADAPNERMPIRCPLGPT